MTKKEWQQAGKLFKNLLLLIVLFFIVDRVLGTIIEHAYNNVPQGDIKTFAHSVTNPSEDVFIYGSSRAVHGYDCAVISNTLGYSCFNSGRENSTIIYHDMILDEMLKKHKPKIIILDVAPKELTWSASQNSKLVLANMILPYVRRDTSFANIAKQYFPEELTKAKLSMLYAYKQAIMPILNANDQSSKQQNVNGYLPLQGSKINKPQAFTQEGETTDSVARNAFLSFVKTVTANNIKLYVIQSPIYVNYYKSSPSLDYIKSVTKEYNVPFWDYSFDTGFYKHQLFYDNVHLNETGAALFSKAVALRIKQDLASANIHLH